jgi:hypothetical protein
MHRRRRTAGGDARVFAAATRLLLHDGDKGAQLIETIEPAIHHDLW